MTSRPEKTGIDFPLSQKCWKTWQQNEKLIVWSVHV